MNDYLVDVPVQINIWIREDCFRKQFDVIKKARPSILFVQSDGGRNEAEWHSILNNRQYLEENLDWNCTVYKIYEDSNNGLYSMLFKVRKIVWDTVDRCVFLEDDDVPSVSFFRFCKEMLDRYENDTRVLGICGFNPLVVSKKVKSDYFFSGESNSWGTATWKRTSYIYEDDFDFADDEYVLDLMKKGLNGKTFKRAVKCAKQKEIDGHRPGIEFFSGLARSTQNGLFITPTHNLISNHGCGADAIHSVSYRILTKSEKRLHYSETYELIFPLKHPKYVIRDVTFEKKYRKLLGNGYPLTIVYRKIVKFLKTLFLEGPSGIIKKFKKNKINKKEK